MNTFFEKNWKVIAVAALMYLFFVYSNWVGYRICSCDTTETYQNQQGRFVRGNTHFYHK